jgi:PAS domain S-box-containing protein
MDNLKKTSRNRKHIARAPAVPAPAHDDWERYFDLYNFAPVPCIRLDRNGVVQEVNRAGCRLLGAQQGLLLSQPLSAFLQRDSRVAFLEHMHRCRSTDASVDTNLTFLTTDHRVVHTRAYTRRWRSEDSTVFWTMLLDVSDRKLLERARTDAASARSRADNEERRGRQTNAATHQFLNVLSHELRTPLTPALFAASRLLENDMPDAARRLGAIIKRNIQAEARLIDDLLDVSLIERGVLSMTFGPIDLHDVVKQSIETCLPQINKKPVTLSVVLNASHHIIQGDLGRLRQVFSNLLTNAIKFTDSGRIEVRSANGEADSVRVMISDTGVGIGPDDVERLFTSFEQHRGQSSRGGLGLGLAICRGVIDAHRGRIRATSRGLGQGATFEVELSTVDDTVRVASEAPQRHSNANASVRLRILLVEDDDETADVLKDMLDHEGHELEMVHNVKQASARANQAWDVVISDLGLPDGSGFDVAAQFAAAVPPPRLIALTGYGGEAALAATGTAGFERHLVKPVDLEQLRSALEP